MEKEKNENETREIPKPENNIERKILIPLPMNRVIVVHIDKCLFSSCRGKAITAG